MKDTTNNNGPRLISAKRISPLRPLEQLRRIAVPGLPKGALSYFAGPYDPFMTAAQLARKDSSRLDPYFEVAPLWKDGDSIPTQSGHCATGTRTFSQHIGSPHTLIVGCEVESLDLPVDKSPFMDWLHQATVNYTRILSE